MSKDIGKSLSGNCTHVADPHRPTYSLCGKVKGTLRIEPDTTIVSCSRCKTLQGR